MDMKYRDYQKVIHCPRTPYAMAYWFYNNHNDIYRKMIDISTLRKVWLDKIPTDDEFRNMIWKVYNAITNDSLLNDIFWDSMRIIESNDE